MRPNAEKIANPIKRVRMVSLKRVGAATERVGLDRDRASARSATHGRTRARNVGRGSNRLAPEGLTRNRDVDAGIFRRGDRELRYWRSATCQIVAIVDRQLRFTNALRRCAATTRRALAIILNAIVEIVLLSKHVSKIIGAFFVALVKDAQGEARGKEIVREANRAIDRTHRQPDITGAGERVPIQRNNFCGDGRPYRAAVLSHCDRVNRE